MGTGKWESCLAAYVTMLVIIRRMLLRMAFSGKLSKDGLDTPVSVQDLPRHIASYTTTAGESSMASILSYRLQAPTRVIRCCASTAIQCCNACNERHNSYTSQNRFACLARLQD